MELTSEWLRRHIQYDPETGTFTHLTDGYQNVFRKGDRVGFLDDLGYWRTSIKGRKYRLHRLAWFYMHGVWPQYDIDHINGDRSDNRLVNLRDVPRKLNLQNGKKRALGAAGLRGVTPKGRRFLAQIGVNGKHIGLGRFDTPQEAHEAYLVAKRRLHPGFMEVS